MKLTFKVNNQILERTDGNKIVADSRNYLYAEFDFLTKDWDGITKTAIFRNGNKSFKTILDQDNTCLVPWEVLECGTMFVSVFGGNLITTNSVTVNITGSGYTEGETPSEPTPDVYTQIISMIDNLESGNVSDEQITKAVEDYLAENPISGVDSKEVESIVSDYISAHKEELKGEKGDPGSNGLDGVDGSNGSDGKSAYDIAVVHGFEGTEEEWLESLKGKDGTDGKDGTSGTLDESIIIDAFNAYMIENPVSAEVGEESVSLQNLAEFERSGLIKESTLYDFSNVTSGYTSAKGVILVLNKNIESDKYVKFTFRATIGKTYTISFYNYDSINYTRYYSQKVIANKEDMVVYITSQKTIGNTYLAIESDDTTSFKYGVGSGGMNRFIKANHTDYTNYDTIVISDMSPQNGMSYIYKIETFLNTTTLVNMLSHRQSDVIIVSKDGLGDYTSVAEAVENANEGDTIYVCSGMYKGTVNVYKHINVVGENKYTTIIYTEHNTYDADPLRAHFGEFYNLTFYAKNPEGGDKSFPYCCHMDNFKTDSNTEQRIILFDNCRFISECNACIGAGTSYKTTFKFVDCDFERDENPNDEKGCIYIHGSSNNTSGEGQIVELINCRGICGSPTKSLTLEVPILIAQNNFFWSTVANSSHGTISIDTLDERSYGNNCDDMNARGKVGDADISAIGDGTITGAILALEKKISAMQ